MSRLIRVLLFITSIHLSVFQIDSICQNENVLIGDVELSIGMDKQFILSKLQINNFIEHQKNNQAYAIWDSKDKSFMLGVIQFDVNDRLSNVHKFLPSFSDISCPDGLRTLYMLLTQDEYKGDIKVSTQEIFQPTYKAYVIDFHIGNRVIKFFIKDNGVTEISELLINN